MEHNHPVETVFIVHQDPVVNTLTTQTLAKVGIQTVAFQSPNKLLRSLPLTSPGCLLVDFMLPEMGGIQLMAELHLRRSFQPVIFMSTRADPLLITQAMNQGGAGFIKRPFQQTELLEIIQKNLAKERRRSHSIHTGTRFLNNQSALTEREREIMERLKVGYSAREVGETLGISHRTVENHRVNIFEKLGISSTYELVRQATVLEMMNTFLE